MFAGFDYGTSHCALGLWRDSAVQLVALENGEPLIPSTLHAPKVALDLPRTARACLKFDSPQFAELRFGEAALTEYLADPTRGYFVKSPKSFLGVAGLTDDIRERFVTVVGAMMGNVRVQANTQAGTEVDAVVIGRPVNFQGLGGRDANEQALSMLESAAQLAGFREISFLFEPMAAALEYEANLTQEEEILVVDIGGGTTDCSFVRVGGARAERLEREVDVLGHSGERRGGNDYDQALALHAVMPEFGFGDLLKSGLPVPNSYYVDAVATNDVNAQQRFYAASTRERLEFFAREAVPVERARRLLEVSEQRATYRLLRGVELAKIDLSQASSARVELSDLEQGLAVEVSRDQFVVAAERLLDHLRSLIDEAVLSAGVKPSRVYLTGGMAKSHTVRDFLTKTYPAVSFIDSDHFLSVTEGLTLWARKLYG